jgi:chromosome segregation ATPase
VRDEVDDFNDLKDAYDFAVEEIGNLLAVKKEHEDCAGHKENLCREISDAKGKWAHEANLHGISLRQLADIKFERDALLRNQGPVPVRIEDLERTLDAVEYELKKTNDFVSDLVGKVEELEHALGGRTEALAKLRETFDKRAAMFDAAEKELKTQKQKSGQKNIELKQQMAKINKLKAQLAKKAESPCQNCAELNTLKTSLDILNTTLASKEEEIAQYQDQGSNLDVLRKEADDLKAQIEHHDVYKRVMTAEVSRLKDIAATREMQYEAVSRERDGLRTGFHRLQDEYNGAIRELNMTKLRSGFGALTAEIDGLKKALANEKRKYEENVATALEKIEVYERKQVEQEKRDQEAWAKLQAENEALCAELQVQRDLNTSTAEKLTVAETQLSEAKDKLAEAQAKLVDAEEDLEFANARTESAVDPAANAEDKKKGWLGGW